VPAFGLPLDFLQMSSIKDGHILSVINPFLYEN